MREFTALLLLASLKLEQGVFWAAPLPGAKSGANCAWYAGIMVRNLCADHSTYLLYSEQDRRTVYTLCIGRLLSASMPFTFFLFYRALILQCFQRIALWLPM